MPRATASRSRGRASSRPARARSTPGPRLLPPADRCAPRGGRSADGHALPRHLPRRSRTTAAGVPRHDRPVRRVRRHRRRRVRRLGRAPDPDQRANVATTLGYGIGEHAPGKQLYFDSLHVAHDLLLAHGRAATPCAPLELPASSAPTTTLRCGRPATTMPTSAPRSSPTRSGTGSHRADAARPIPRGLRVHDGRPRSARLHGDHPAAARLLRLQLLQPGEGRGCPGPIRDAVRDPRPARPPPSPTGAGRSSPTRPASG